MTVNKHNQGVLSEWALKDNDGELWYLNNFLTQPDDLYLIHRTATCVKVTKDFDPATVSDSITDDENDALFTSMLLLSRLDRKRQVGWCQTCACEGIAVAA